MSRMHNPAHPGEVLREWLPAEMTVTRAAKELQVSRVTLSKVLNCKAGVTAWMVLRLARMTWHVARCLAWYANTVGLVASRATAKSEYQAD